MPVRLLLLSFVLACAASAQAPDVGSGSPTPAIQQAFVDAYYRNGFNRTVSVPPLADVKKLGATGLFQEFNDAAKTAGVKLALIKANTSSNIPEGTLGVAQVQAAMYAYFNTVGVNNAGYPSNDTTPCPGLTSAALLASACQYQLFDKPVALFVYGTAGPLSGATFTVRDPFYTKWSGRGGVQVLGPAVTAETAVTGAVNGGNATAQTFDRGVIFNIASGSLSGKLLAVVGDVFALYSSLNAQSGPLGFPTAEELVVANRRKRQSFEGGSIEYDPNTPGSAVLRTPIASIRLSPSEASVRLNLGDTYTLSAILTDAGGAPLTDRDVIWTSSNSRVVTVQTAGATTVIRATGGGSAVVSATSEGKSSPAVTFFVAAPCCGIGEGAPTQTVANAFQNAIARNKLAVKLPAPSPVTRAGAGFVQSFTSADGAQSYLVAVPDKSLNGWLVSGPVLARYLELGGPTGALGFPASDATAAGRQLFDGGALAGSPVQLVSGLILAKWAAAGYETGVAGPPASTPLDTLTFKATQGKVQSFQSAIVFVASTGTQANRAFLVSGLILAKYAESGGAAGRLGAPVSDEFGLNSRRRQDFEGGFVDYAPGDASAKITESPRQPLITATPPVVLAGGVVRLALGGFDAGANVRVSVAGQPDFQVAAVSGAYVWEVFVPASSRSSTVTVRAVAGSASAQGSYAIRAVADAQLKLAVSSGDGQTGAPGAALPQLLRVAVRDESGNPAAGQTVTFQASPGASVTPVTSVTGSDGLASASLRLPPSEGVALATATAARQTVTFGARGARVGLTNFPRFNQASDNLLGGGPATIRQKGSLLTALAGVLRYLQDRGDLPAPNGNADPALLNQFLSKLCIPDSQANPVCDGFYQPSGTAEQIANPWRIPAFVNNAADISVENPDPAAIRDLAAAGSPVIVALSSPSGAHYVTAIGVGADGSVAVYDSNPSLARPSLADYLSVFQISGALRIVPRPFQSAFLFISEGPVLASSLTGLCGAVFTTLTATAADAAGQAAGAPLRFASCDGTDAAYQADFSSPQPFRASFRDLSNPGTSSDASAAGAVSYLVTRASGKWTLQPVTPQLTAASVISAASGSRALSPGGLVSVYGAGFGGDVSKLQASVNGTPARILSASPFQVNLQIPPNLEAGTASLAVMTPAGAAAADILLQDVSPDIFVLGTQAAITNQNNLPNTPGNPARRGEAIVIYCTGLGLTQPAGNLATVRTPVRVRLAGLDLTPFYAGTSFAPGVYQVNVIVPAALPPGLALDLQLQQSGVSSNRVAIAVQ